MEGHGDGGVGVRFRALWDTMSPPHPRDPDDGVGVSVKGQNWPWPSATLGRKVPPATSCVHSPESEVECEQDGGDKYVKFSAIW